LTAQSRRSAGRFDAPSTTAYRRSSSSNRAPMKRLVAARLSPTRSISSSATRSSSNDGRWRWNGQRSAPPSVGCGQIHVSPWRSSNHSLETSRWNSRATVVHRRRADTGVTAY
jgi:hypothetical protein